MNKVTHNRINFNMIFFLGILSLVIFNNVFSQDDFILPKSSKLVGGDISFKFELPDLSNKTTAFYIESNPNFGYAIKDNLFVGGNFTFNYSKYKLDTPSILYHSDYEPNTIREFGAGIFIENYTLKGIFYGLSAQITSFKSNISGYSKMDNYKYTPYMGYAIKMGSNTLLQIQLSNIFRFYKLNSENKIGSTTMVGCGFQIVL